MPEEYPTPSFNFRVEFDIDGITYSSSSFQEVSGLTAERDIIAYREGGENRFEHKLPGGARFSNLALKKGFISDQKIFEWLTDNNLGKPTKMHDFKILLLDENSKPAAVWMINKAFPIAIETAGFEEDKKRIAVEKLEFAFESITRMD